MEMKSPGRPDHMVQMLRESMEGQGSLSRLMRSETQEPKGDQKSEAVSSPHLYVLDTVK